MILLEMINMTNRITILRDILLDLHNGASPESVQEQFNHHFTGVSAMEISLMEHELMSSDSGVTFEDVMKLCNVHANLFKGAIHDVTVADTEQQGHPVYVFKEENLALRACLLRIRRLLDFLNSDTIQSSLEDQDDILSGLKRQFHLLSQFKRHYDRKEQLFFPIMERYGHDSPPKVMWGVDDDIRDLFDTSNNMLHQLSVPFDSNSIDNLLTSFDQFAYEFEEMIFKEEAILLMILLETFTQDDWLNIAHESDGIGYAIISPTEKWIPERIQFGTQDDVAVSNNAASNITQHTHENLNTDHNETTTSTRVINTPEGQFTITFTPTVQDNSTSITRDTQQPFGNGYLSIDQANMILNQLPMEITFVNKDNIFQYYNDHCPTSEMIFKRTPSQIGRHVDLCHPPKLLNKVHAIFDGLRSGERDKYDMWFKKEDKFIHVTYAALRNDNGEFEGVLEYVQDIQAFRDIDNDFYREID